MASINAIRRVALAARPARSFHSSARSLIQVGDKIPNLDVLVENSPGNKVNLAEQIKGKALIIGVPAAFSKSIFLRRELAVGWSSYVFSTNALYNDK
jgi:2-Cys peroxiredoxin 5